MSDFIKLTKLTVAWDKLEPIPNIFAVKPVNIISLTETELNNNIKCTEIEAECNNGVIRYYVKEPIDEILRKIDPLPYIDSNEFIYDTSTSCKTCKYYGSAINSEPCFSCTFITNKWEPKEDQNESSI